MACQEMQRILTPMFVMNRRLILMFSVLFSALLANLVVAKPKFDGPTGKPFVYKTSASRERTMEVYFPPNHDPAKARVPGMILFHGGGWQGGDLSQFRAACAYFASRGLVCATAEYRMLGGEAKTLPPTESKKRACITDAISAIRWFKQQSAAFGMDPNRIIAGGGSAGGHISALATMNPGLEDPADPKGVDTRVVAYVWFNPAFTDKDAADPAVDVLQHLKSEMPPTIAMFGDKDEWLPGWEATYAKSQQLGCKDIEHWVAEGQNHGFFNSEPWRSVTLIEVDRFLVRHRLLSGEPTLKLPAGADALVLKLPK